MFGKAPYLLDRRRELSRILFQYFIARTKKTKVNLFMESNILKRIDSITIYESKATQVTFMKMINYSFSGLKIFQLKREK